MKCVKGATGPFLDRLYASFRIGDFHHIHCKGALCRMNMEERLSNLITDHILLRLIPELEMLPCAVPMCWRCTCIRARSASLPQARSRS